jgi:hypothetical protein
VVQNGLLLERSIMSSRGQKAQAFGERLQRAVALVDMAAEATLARSEMTTFWAGSTPAGSPGPLPYLCVYHACALLLCGRS